MFAYESVCKHIWSRGVMHVCVRDMQVCTFVGEGVPEHCHSIKARDKHPYLRLQVP